MTTGLRWAVFLPLVVAACSGDAAHSRRSASDTDTLPPSPGLANARAPAPLVRLLSEGQVLFGMFSGPTTREQGAEMGRNRQLDFVFYSLESGPFDIPAMAAYMEGIAEGSGADRVHPLVLRVPPVRDGAEQARENVDRALEAGVAGIVFPHVESATDATTAVSAMGEASWPGNPDGTLLNMLIVEDRAAMERVGELVSTAGVSVVFAGPGDLRRAYAGDMEAVEDAIQSVLAACNEHGVACGITAGADDIEERIGQGFRVFIVSDPAAVVEGRQLAGRN